MTVLINTLASWIEWVGWESSDLLQLWRMWGCWLATDPWTSESDLHGSLWSQWCCECLKGSSALGATSLIEPPSFPFCFSLCKVYSSRLCVSSIKAGTRDGFAPNCISMVLDSQLTPAHEWIHERGSGTPEKFLGHLGVCFKKDLIFSFLRAVLGAQQNERKVRSVPIYVCRPIGLATSHLFVDIPAEWYICCKQLLNLHRHIVITQSP